MKYACIAATAHGGRCRNTSGENQRCHEHQGAPAIEKADTVMVRANSNPNWVRKFRDLGVEVKDVDFEARRAQHAQQAADVGRKFERYRQKGDSGTLVYDPYLGNVSGYEMLHDLLRVYRRMQIGMEPVEGRRGMCKLTLTLSNDQEVQAMNKELGRLFLEFMLCTWEFVYIYDNPPHDGRRTNTVNCVHRDPDRDAAQSIRFANGLWVVEPFVEK